MSRKIGKIECTKEVFELLIKAFYRNINHETLRAQLQIPASRGVEYSDIQAAFEWVEPPRWRAEKYDNYYYVNARGDVETEIERGDYSQMYESGNYFKTANEAIAYAQKWRELFKENT